jgi:hypothetical protein
VEWSVRAIERKPDFVPAYLLLARTIRYLNPPTVTIGTVAYAPTALLLLAAANNPTDPNIYSALADHLFFRHVDETEGSEFIDTTTLSIRMHDGSVMSVIDLCIKALPPGCKDGFTYGILYLCMQKRALDHVCLPDQGCLTLDDIGLYALQYGAGYLETTIAPDFQHTVRGWVPRLHRAFKRVHGGPRLDELFATMLMGMQKLETNGVLAIEHNSVLEDMLEGWTLQDSTTAFQ